MRPRNASGSGRARVSLERGPAKPDGRLFGRPKSFRVAGRTFTTDLAGAELAPFEHIEIPSVSPAFKPPTGRTEQRRTFSGSGWVAGSHRSLECLFDDVAYRLRVDNVGELWVAADGNTSGSHEVNDLDLARQAFLGPALNLGLAAQGTFCLHASAVESNGGGVVAFAGESGAGKSTLARELCESADHTCRRVADDILALELESGQPTARSDYPQPQLSAEEQPFLTCPAELPLRAVCVIRRILLSSAPIRLERLAAGKALALLIRHSVASKLFDPSLLRQHFGFFGTIARGTPVFRLSYPWRRQAIPQIVEALTLQLDGAGFAETPEDSS